MEGPIEETQSRPVVVVIGGPNGAGKTTCASLLLPTALHIPHFVNADMIADGLAAFAPETVALQAGRIMLSRLKELASDRDSFAFETTMASRSLVPFLERLKGQGYEVHVAFLWLRSPELAIERVAERVRRGGHSIPEETIRRRFARGIENFREFYRPVADSWIVSDNSGRSLRHPATGVGTRTHWIFDRKSYDEFESYRSDQR